MTQPIDFSLRPAKEDDSEFIYQLIFETMRDYVVATWGVWDEMRTRTESVQALLPVANLIMIGDRPCGLVTIERHSDHIELEQLYLLPACQRMGIGTWLIKSLVAEAAACGHPVRLSVLQVNPARRLYERLGFVVTGETLERVLMEFTPMG